MNHNTHETTREFGNDAHKEMLCRPRQNHRIEALFMLAFALSITYRTAQAEEKPEPVTIGYRYVMESKILDERRSYLVHKPIGYDTRDDSYPVLVLLDGETHFAHTSATVDFLSENGRIPPMIVVGVPNTNRLRDLTPPGSNSAPNSPPGGADKFLGFIGDELVPEIEKKYRTHPYRIVVGHSLGGLVALYSLRERPQLFNGYVAISPSLQVNDQALVKSYDAFLKSHRDLHADVYMTIGNEIGPMLGGFWKLASLFEEQQPKNLRWRILRSPEETHNTNPYRSTYDGLQAIFDGYYIHDPMMIYDQAGMAGIEKHFAQVSERLGFRVTPTEATYAGLVSPLMQQKRTKDSIVVARHAVKQYPNLGMGHFQLAQLYMMDGDQPHARDELLRTLELYPGMQMARATLKAMNVALPAEPMLSLKQMDALTGRYKTKESIATISIRDAKLFIQSSSGECELRMQKEDRLYCVDADVEFTVNKDKSGRVASIRIEYPDYQEIEPKIR